MAKLPAAATAQVFQFRRDPAAIPILNLQVADRQTETAPEPDDRPALDLTGRPPIVLLFGSGKVGKTTLARYIGERAIGRSLFLATMDPTTKTLANFAKDVEHPRRGDNPVTWLGAAVDFLTMHKHPGAIDFGPGVEIPRAFLAELPGLEAAVESAGMAVVAFYLLSPRGQDLGEFVKLGFQPAATAFVCNLGAAGASGDPAEFDTILAQPAVKEAIANGARVIWMPKMSHDVFQHLEKWCLSFTNPMHGEHGLSGVTSPLQVRAWLRRMDEAFAPVASWLP